MFMTVMDFICVNQKKENKMKNIYDYSLEQLTEYFASIKQKPFRAKQVFSWLYQKDARSFDDMSDLSKDLRNQLKVEFSLDVKN